MATEQTHLLAHEEGQPDQEGVLNELVDAEVRNGFIKKVYGILSCQIILTILLAIPFHMIPYLKLFVISTPALIYVAWGMAFVFIVIITCLPGVAQTYPNNYVLLFAFTIVEAFLIGVYTAMHNTLAVIIAAAVTCLITIVLSIYAATTKTDFTGWGLYLLVASIALVSIGILALIFGLALLWTIVIMLGVVLFSFYLIYDTQLIVGGKHTQYQFTVDDYVLAALCLYLDIINLFMHILALSDG